MRQLKLGSASHSVALNSKKLKAYFILMARSKSSSIVFEENASRPSYVHSSSRGHEAVQIATALQLKPSDFLFPYYRDDAMLLALGIEPYDLFLQWLAKGNDPFSGGRNYYAHISLRNSQMPQIPHQSSSTGMQAIPAVGAALGIAYKRSMGLLPIHKENPIVVCSLGDSAVSEGEVSEALQMASLKKLPVLFLVQDNGWGISAKAEEVRSQNAFEFAKGFKELEALSIDGTDFSECDDTLKNVVQTMRREQRPFLVHAKVELLTHHTSGVRMENYRDDLESAWLNDPYPKLRNLLLENGFSEAQVTQMESDEENTVRSDFERALKASEPEPSGLNQSVFAPTSITEESGERSPQGKIEPSFMVECALSAMEELLEKHQECLFFGQDVGKRLGGVFREAVSLAHKFGDHRVFNAPTQEAFIVGSTAGLSAAGLKPIVEVQFADYLWAGLNQLFSEISRSYFLSNGKWPVSMVLRVPVGAFGRGGPYHSSSIESVLSNIKGIKIAYPSNGADLKGLLKAAYYDPNPVVMLEHKGLYWSKLPGTEAAKTIIPDENYVLPLGKAALLQEVRGSDFEERLSVITYGAGVHWAMNASRDMKEQVEIVDLRSIVPLDEKTIFESVQKTKKCLVLSEEPLSNSFGRSLAGLIQENCFSFLDAPVVAMGAIDVPAIPLNFLLEQAVLPSTEKVKQKIVELLNY